MGIVFTLRLTGDEWNSGTRAWDCSALDIPTAKVAIFNKGNRLDPTWYEVKKGPASIHWVRGTKQPEEIFAEITLDDALVPKAQSDFWKNLAILIPVIVAIITIIGSIIVAKLTGGKESPSPLPTKASLVPSYMLNLAIEPIDETINKAFPRPHVTLNGTDHLYPLQTPITKDTFVLIDMSETIESIRRVESFTRKQQAYIKQISDEAVALGKTIDESPPLNYEQYYRSSANDPEPSVVTGKELNEKVLEAFASDTLPYTLIKDAADRLVSTSREAAEKTPPIRLTDSAPSLGVNQTGVPHSPMAPPVIPLPPPKVGCGLMHTC